MHSTKRPEQPTKSTYAHRSLASAHKTHQQRAVSVQNVARSTTQTLSAPPITFSFARPACFFTAVAAVTKTIPFESLAMASDVAIKRDEPAASTLSRAQTENTHPERKEGHPPRANHAAARFTDPPPDGAQRHPPPRLYEACETSDAFNWPLTDGARVD